MLWMLYEWRPLSLVILIENRVVLLNEDLSRQIWGWLWPIISCFGNRLGLGGQSLRPISLRWILGLWFFLQNVLDEHELALILFSRKQIHLAHQGVDSRILKAASKLLLVLRRKTLDMSCWRSARRNPLLGGAVTGINLVSILASLVNAIWIKRNLLLSKQLLRPLVLHDLLRAAVSQIRLLNTSPGQIVAFLRHDLGKRMLFEGIMIQAMPFKQLISFVFQLYICLFEHMQISGTLIAWSEYLNKS